MMTETLAIRMRVEPGAPPSRRFYPARLTVLPAHGRASDLPSAQPARWSVEPVRTQDQEFKDPAGPLVLALLLVKAAAKQAERRLTRGTGGDLVRQGGRRVGRLDQIDQVRTLFMVTLDAVVVNVALPSIRRDLGTPGTRTAWHSHALGQTLYVSEGTGLVQSRAARSPASTGSSALSLLRIVLRVQGVTALLG